MILFSCVRNAASLATQLIPWGVSQAGNNEQRSGARVRNKNLHMVYKRCVAISCSCLRPQDHKPNRPDEMERIKQAGGMVIHKRVMGELAVSRAFGDRAFKMGIKVTRGMGVYDRDDLLVYCLLGVVFCQLLVGYDVFLFSRFSFFVFRKCLCVLCSRWASSKQETDGSAC